MSIRRETRQTLQTIRAFRRVAGVVAEFRKAAEEDRASGGPAPEDLIRDLRTAELVLLGMLDGAETILAQTAGGRRQ